MIGWKVVEWDQRQLRHIAEIARRVPLEGATAVAKDFWRRGIKDRRGPALGEAKAQTVQSFSHPLPELLSGRAMVPPHEVERAATGPYDGLAASIPEPKTFRAEHRPKGWARGGTARREQGCAERKARRRAAGNA